MRIDRFIPNTTQSCWSDKPTLPLTNDETSHGQPQKIGEITETGICIGLQEITKEVDFNKASS